MVQSAVTAVHVHVQGRVDHRVIQGGIEHGLLVGRSVHFDEGKRLIPCSGRFGTEGLETLSGRLGPQVLQRPLRSGCAYGHFHRQLGMLAGIELHPGHHLAARHLRKVVVLREFRIATLVFGRFPVRPAIFRHGLGERNGKVCGIRACPPVGHPITGEQGVIEHPHFGPKRLSVIIVDSMHQIQDQMPVGIHRK